MAKVTITIEDVEGTKSSINLNYAFEPELPTVPENEEEKVTLTPAQSLALNINRAMQTMSKFSPPDEQTTTSCAESGESTCCGGNCHSAEG